MRKTREKINKTKTWIFEKIKKKKTIDKSLFVFIMKKGEGLNQ